MKNSKNIILVVVVVLILGAIGLLSGFGRGDSGPSPFANESGVEVEKQKFEVGQEAPDFVLTDFEGNQVRLSDFRGKPVLIDFWAKWCPFCTQEMPEINQVFNELDGELVVLGIHRTSTESFETGRGFAESLGIDYILLQDTTDDVYEIYGKGRGFMPQAAYIDQEGLVVSSKAGPKSAQEIRDAVNEIIDSASSAE